MKRLTVFALIPSLLLVATAGNLLAQQPQSELTDRAAAFFDDREVREIRLYFDEDANWYSTLFNAHRSNPEDPYFPCRFRSGDVEIPRIGCRFKGNSSFNRNGIKKPFKLDFNEYDDDATFVGLKKLNLHNFDLQPDFMREKLLQDIAGNYVAAMRSVYVRLYVNDAFYGLYLGVEQPDKTMTQSRWGASEDGNLYEAEEQMGGTRPNLSWLGSDPSAYYNVYLLKTNEEENDYSGLIEFLDVLNNTPTAELPAKIEPIADVENWMTWMAMNNLVVNLDSYLGVGAEYYLYDRTFDGKFIHIQWDHNESFGITGDGTVRLNSPSTTDPFWLPTATTGGPGGGPGGGGSAASNARPLLQKLWAVDEYKQLYLRALARGLREGLEPETVRARVAELASLIRPHVQEDPNKAYTSAQFETAQTAQVANIPGIQQFADARYAYLRSYLNNLARPSDLRINELVTSNDGTLLDEADDADPWIEIYNPGPGPLSLDGFTLTDDPANPTKWALPSRTLADGEFLVVWLDNETSEGDTHANFTVPAANARLLLFSSAVSNTEPVDALTVTALPAGQSQMRVGLFGSTWEVTAQPTPSAVNRLVTPEAPVSTGTGKLLVNEIMADNDSAFQDPDEPGAYEDWFEVYNPGTEAIDMSGMYITDNPNNPTKWQVGQGVVIPAGGFLVFMADNEPAQGPRHTSWALSADGESVSIYDTDGVTLIDAVTFGPQTTDVSYGRSPDGGASLTGLSAPTPGSPNAAPLP
jgi:spore coat protein CotH